VAVHGGAIVVSLDAEPVDRAAASLDAAQRLIQCGPYAVDASAPRVIENFLDLSHLGFVHHGILGDRDDGRVHEYSVTQHGGQLVATGCRIRQPRAHADSAVAVEVDYVYRVLSPLMVQLEKHTADDRSAATRVDTIRLRVQPVDDTHSRAFIDMAISDHDTPEADLRAFQDAIFAQDLPILENQLPVRLPLDPAVESSMPSDRLSVAYRRYLNERGVETGVVR
jgi:phenylpropionate dioxygenase-like ring-hydroxylating dioxygenase large terminal subunit